MEFVAGALGMNGSVQLRSLFEIVFIVGITVLPGISLLSAKAYSHEKIAWLLLGVLASTYSSLIWEEGLAYLRALSEFYFLGMIVLLGSKRYGLAPLAIGSVVLWLSYMINIY